MTIRIPAPRWGRGPGQGCTCGDNGGGPATIDLYWLPLGAGGWFVRLNGRIYERLLGLREGRAPQDLYHTALAVAVDGRRFVIENAWPVPRGDGRGVTLEGPVGFPSLGKLRAFRYEVRRWENGTIPDVAEAVASPQTVSQDAAKARALLDAVRRVPTHTWGRDDLQAGDMWNSNSVVAWLLEVCGVGATGIVPPRGGRAPGWTAGIVAANGGRPRSV